MLAYETVVRTIFSENAPKGCHVINLWTFRASVRDKCLVPAIKAKLKFLNLDLRGAGVFNVKLTKTLHSNCQSNIPQKESNWRKSRPFYHFIREHFVWRLMMVRATSCLTRISSHECETLSFFIAFRCERLLRSPFKLSWSRCRPRWLRKQ